MNPRHQQKDEQCVVPLTEGPIFNEVEQRPRLLFQNSCFWIKWHWKPIVCPQNW